MASGLKFKASGSVHPSRSLSSPHSYSQQQSLPVLPVNPPQQGYQPVIIDPVLPVNPPQQSYYPIQNDQHLQFHLNQNLRLFTYNKYTNMWNIVGVNDNPRQYLYMGNLYGYGNIWQYKYLKYKMKYLRLKGVNMNFADEEM